VTRLCIAGVSVSSLTVVGSVSKHEEREYYNAISRPDRRHHRFSFVIGCGFCPDIDAFVR